MRVARRTFASGEIDEDQWHSSDLGPVRNGAAEITNFIVKPQGGLERTPGTEHIAVANSAERVKLMPFVPSRDEAYCSEWGPSYVRVRPASDPSQFDDVVTEYVAADLPFLQMVQSADIQWVVSGKAPKELQRLASLDFQFVDMQLVGGPYARRNDNQAIVITASAETGSVTLTSAVDYFLAGHVGSFMRLEENDLSYVALWKPGVSVNVGDVIRSGDSAYEITSAGDTSADPPTHLEGEVTDGLDAQSVTYLYLHSGFGVVRITAVNSAREATADVVKRLPGDVAQAGFGTWKWNAGAWSDVQGYPVTITLYKNSLWAGGSLREPYQIWKSALDGFDDWEFGTEDDAGLDRGLFSDQTDSIRWMSPGKFLAIGTAGSEWVARPESSGDTVRPDNLITEETTTQGSSDVPGITVNNTPIFVDASLEKLLSFEFNFRTDKWDPDDLTEYCSHIFGVGILELHYQRSPWPILWAVLADGDLGAMTWKPKQNIRAAHRHTFGGSVETMSVIPDALGQQDQVWLAVRRDPGGVNQLHIERMFPRFRPYRNDLIQDARYLQAAKVYDLTEPATIFAGLEHLNGKTVVAIVDGSAHPEMVVENGQVVLNFAGRNVAIGLAYTSRVTTLPFDLGIEEEFQTGRNMRVTDLSLAFRGTLGGHVVARGKRERIFPLGDTNLDEPPKLFSGIRKVDVPAKANGGQLTYETNAPWPATLTGMFPQFEV